MKPAGWAKLPGTAIMIARHRAISPTRLQGEVQPRGQRAATPCRIIRPYGTSAREDGRKRPYAAREDGRKRPYAAREDGRKRPYAALPTLLLAAILATSPAGAETIEDFYRGKTITMIVGTGVGAGAVSAYPMALAPVIRKYLPGHPNLVVSYMPGAGGIKAASYIYGIAAQDGTAWGFITRGFLLAPLLKIPQAQFDPTRFNWIGSPTRTVSMGLVWNASTEVRTIQDAMRMEVVVGATSIAQDTGIYPRALNRIAGTKFKIVPGYAGLGAVDLALERGEVQGKVGSTWKSLNSGPSARWVTDKLVTVLVQLGVKKAPDIPPDVPLGLDLARTPEDRQVLEVLCAPSATGYPSFMGPGVPKERVDAVRRAYLQSLKDPEFIEALQKQGLDLDPVGAEELAAVVRGIYALPEAAVEGARDLLPAL
jgi:tripartite-type tricarboxylate transporter receptor subunit TctC